MTQTATVLGRGRPKSEISREQLSYLTTDLCFSWEKSASLLGTSAKTLRRRGQEWNISKYTDISDQELDDVVSDVHHNFPSCGETLLIGHLQSRKVQ